MQLHRHPRQHESGAADWLRYALVVLIAVLALDLTRRFVSLSRRGKSKPPSVAAQPASREPTNEVAYLPPATAEPLPMARVTPAPVPPDDRPDAPEPGTSPAASAAVTNIVPRAGQPMPPGVAAGRVQADYRLPSGVVPVTIFKPGAITPIAVPGDDGGGTRPTP